MRFGKQLMLFSIVSIVLLAGCTKAPSGPTGGNGVIIKSFSPEFSSVDSGTPVSFLLKVQNVGGAKAADVKAQLFGLSTDWTAAIMTPDVGAVETLAGSLAAPDQLSGMQGEETTKEWSASASPSKDTDVTYDASLRVYYTYETTASGLVRFVSSTYQRSVTQQGQQLSQPIGVIESTSSAGPLLVTVLARTPVVGSDASSTGRVQLEIQNVGSGRVYDGSEPLGASDLDYIKSIKISGVGSATAEGKCAGKDSVSGVVTFDQVGAVDNRQKLLAGKSKTINCEIKTADVASTNFKNIALNIEIDYEYFVDSATSLTVLKKFQ